jgi:hypothetical protein
MINDSVVINIIKSLLGYLVLVLTLGSLYPVVTNSLGALDIAIHLSIHRSERSNSLSRTLLMAQLNTTRHLCAEGLRECIGCGFLNNYRLLP